MTQQSMPGINSLFPKLGLERMLAEYWPHSPVWRSGSLDRLGALAELQDVGQVVDRARRARANARGLFPGTGRAINEMELDASHANRMYDSGASVSFAQIQRWHPVIAEWTAALAKDLRVPVETTGCNLYISPVGRGLPMHFDNHEGIIVQLAGSKIWDIAENRSVRYPTSNSSSELSSSVQEYADRPAPKRMPKGNRVVMKPGSVLAIPRGYWHQTSAKEPSISLSFGFQVPTWIEVVRAQLVEMLLPKEAWRAPAAKLWSPEGEQAKWNELKVDLARLVSQIDVAELAKTYR